MICIKLRRGTAAEWTSADTILALAEPGVETDTGKLKIGDGSTAWTSLPYITTTPAAAGQVADVCLVSFGAETERAIGLGDNPFGVKLQRPVTFTSVTFRVATADASGNLVVELRKNGVAVAGTSTTIAANSQVSGGTSTGSWSFAEGDILTVYVTAVGTTPGDGLVADVQGITS